MNKFKSIHVRKINDALEVHGLVGITHDNKAQFIPLPECKDIQQLRVDHPATRIILHEDQILSRWLDHKGNPLEAEGNYYIATPNGFQSVSKNQFFRNDINDDCKIKGKYLKLLPRETILGKKSASGVVEYLSDDKRDKSLELIQTPVDPDAVFIKESELDDFLLNEMIAANKFHVTWAGPKQKPCDPIWFDKKVVGVVEEVGDEANGQCQHTGVLTNGTPELVVEMLKNGRFKLSRKTTHPWRHARLKKGMKGMSATSALKDMREAVATEFSKPKQRRYPSSIHGVAVKTIGRAGANLDTDARDDFNLAKSEHYFSIGHDGPERELSGGEDDSNGSLWIHKNGKLHTAEGAHSTHPMKFGNNAGIDYPKGRFDHGTGEMSFVPHREVSHEQNMTALRDAVSHYKKHGAHTVHVFESQLTEADNGLRNMVGSALNSSVHRAGAVKPTPAGFDIAGRQSITHNALTQNGFKHLGTNQHHSPVDPHTIRTYQHPQYPKTFVHVSDHGDAHSITATQRPTPGLREAKKDDADLPDDLKSHQKEFAPDGSTTLSPRDSFVAQPDADHYSQILSRFHRGIPLNNFELALLGSGAKDESSAWNDPKFIHDRLSGMKKQERQQAEDSAVQKLSSLPSHEHEKFIASLHPDTVKDVKTRLDSLPWGKDAGYYHHLTKRLGESIYNDPVNRQTRQQAGQNAETANSQDSHYNAKEYHWRMHSNSNDRPELMAAHEEAANWHELAGQALRAKKKETGGGIDSRRAREASKRAHLMAMGHGSMESVNEGSYDREAQVTAALWAKGKREGNSGTLRLIGKKAAHEVLRRHGMIPHDINHLSSKNIVAKHTVSGSTGDGRYFLHYHSSLSEAARHLVESTAKYQRRESKHNRLAVKNLKQAIEKGFGDYNNHMLDAQYHVDQAGKFMRKRHARLHRWLDKGQQTHESSDAMVYYHGTPSGDLRGAANGLHIGTRESARQALTARIGHPADGEWDGTREYGKTLLAGKKTMKAKGIFATGHNVDAPEDDYLPGSRKMPSYGDKSLVSGTAKPHIFPVRIVGPMSNTPYSPHKDFHANGFMRRSLASGHAKRGYYYRNEGEDAGSISAVVPSAAHIERISKPAHESNYSARGWKSLSQQAHEASQKAAQAEPPRIQHGTPPISQPEWPDAQHALRTSGLALNNFTRGIHSQSALLHQAAAKEHRMLLKRHNQLGNASNAALHFTAATLHRAAFVKSHAVFGESTVTAEFKAAWAKHKGKSVDEAVEWAHGDLRIPIVDGLGGCEIQVLQQLIKRGPTKVPSYVNLRMTNEQQMRTIAKLVEAGCVVLEGDIAKPLVDKNRLDQITKEYGDALDIRQSELVA